MKNVYDYKDVYIVTNIAPHYREALWFSLLGLEKQKYYFLFGKDSSSGIRIIDFSNRKYDQYKNRIYNVRNVWINRKVMVWQSGVMKICIREKIDTAIFLGDMYCISTWLGALICRVRGVMVVFWGHGIYGGEKKLRLIIRKTFYRLAHKHLLYERRAKELMVKNGFEKNNIYVVFNSLDYEKQKKYRLKYQGVVKGDVMRYFLKPELPTIVFIGRLTAQKKIEILIQAILEINVKDVKINLLIIGTGNEEGKLKRMVSNGIKSSWLNFTGAIYDEEEIAKYLSASDLCVSPGEVGLTSIHSLSYGTPVCTHSDLRYQMPEVEAIIDGYNGFYFERDNVEDLKKKIKQWFSNADDRQVIRRRCYEVIDSYYNPHYQLGVFRRLVRGENPEI